MKPLTWDAINPLTGLPFTWDDPNLRWGDPAVFLEPGDPGFVPYATSVNPKTTKGTKMKRNAYYPTRTAEKLVWLENFRNKLAKYQAALGLSAGEVAAGIADARWLIYVLGSWLPAVRGFAPACTAAAEQVQSGKGTTAPLPLPTFTPPDLPAAVGSDPAVVPTAPGAETRIQALVGKIKEAAGFTQAIGEDLDVLGTEQARLDPTTLQPRLTLRLQEGAVRVEWGWQGFGEELDQLEIQVDRGAGWTLLTYDTTPGYLDTAPLPATATKWKYRAIYRIDDARIGKWSETVEILVSA